jgi:adenylate cyclase
MLLRFDQGVTYPDGALPRRHSELKIDLIVRAKQGDSEALGRLYEHYAPQLLRYITARLGDPEVQQCVSAPAGVLTPAGCTILVVDDFEANRKTLARNLQLLGHIAVVAEDGAQALALLREQPFDMVLLDLVMPGMDGYVVLEQMRADPNLRHIPVVVVSGQDDLASIVRCIELGAEDYLFKPFDAILLRARISACIEKKRLRDQEQAYLSQLRVEQEQSERLLLNILPGPIAARLKQEHVLIAESFADVTVLFADIVDFTPLAARVAPAELVGILNDIFSRFDELAEWHGLEKIKTIGDAYMVVGGLPLSRPDHAEAVAEMAIDMQQAIDEFSTERGEPFELRIGISSGPAIAGVIGTKKFSYDLWGDTVNTASRMEALGQGGRIHVSAATYEHLREQYQFAERGPLQVKGKGEMITYFLTGRAERDQPEVLFERMV